jgi:hypothetical protein
LVGPLPLVGFILPAVVYCAAITTGYKLEVPSRIFGLKLSNLPKLIRICTLLILGAFIQLSFDMVFWIFIVFGLAPGPTPGAAVVGGLHEALLDRRITQYIGHPSTTEDLSPRAKAELS